jgi:transcriptional regulator with XRE-family HTH domain
MTANKPGKAPKRFVQMLKKAMDDHPGKLSLREVARRADLSPAYLSYLLSGDRGIPSNAAIGRLETVLGLPEDKLFEAAGKPNEVALEFFRKDEAADIVRTLAPLPKKQLSRIRAMIDRFVQSQNSSKK